jgi:hypothetical protein
VPAADDWWLAELERAQRWDEQACQCGHARRQHVISGGAGFDWCTAVLPGQRGCPCGLFRPARRQVPRDTQRPAPKVGHQARHRSAPRPSLAAQRAEEPLGDAHHVHANVDQLE